FTPPGTQPKKLGFFLAAAFPAESARGVLVSFPTTFCLIIKKISKNMLTCETKCCTMTLPTKRGGDTIAGNQLGSDVRPKYEG
ncbi:MAG: hypothetical protein LBH21_06175, partial [Gracilibacteraceae bacterium]|nr:hypothetical protein [Gracilibacteraceae bacterium]